MHLHKLCKCAKFWSCEINICLEKIDIFFVSFSLAFPKIAQNYTKHLTILWLSINWRYLLDLNGQIGWCLCAENVLGYISKFNFTWDKSLPTILTRETFMFFLRKIATPNYLMNLQWWHNYCWNHSIFLTIMN